MEKIDEIEIEDLLNEYNKYLISRIINKEYDINILRNKAIELSEKTEFINCQKQHSNYEILKEIQSFIKIATQGKSFKIE